MSEVVEGQKKVGGSKLPIPYTERRKKIVISLQGEYQIKHGRKITAVELAAAIFDEGVKTYHV